MDLTTIVIAAVIVLILAVVLIGLYFTLRGGQNDSSQQKSSTGQAGFIEAARLGRDKTTDMLLVVMDGKLVSKASELSTGQRQRLASTANDLLQWLGKPVTGPSPAPVSHDVTEQAITPPAASFSSQSSAMDTGAPVELKPVTTNPVEALRHAISASKPAPTYKSITAQIDEVLQTKLIGTPLEKLGVHLAESPNQGVIVNVGLEQYQGIDAVPNEEVRNLIRSAVAEWEKRNR